MSYRFVSVAHYRSAFIYVLQVVGILEEEKEEAIKFLEKKQGIAFGSYIGATAITPEDEKFLVLNHG